MIQWKKDKTRSIHARSCTSLVQCMHVVHTFDWILYIFVYDFAALLRERHFVPDGIAQGLLTVQWFARKFVQVWRNELDVGYNLMMDTDFWVVGPVSSCYPSCISGVGVIDCGEVTTGETCLAGSVRVEVTARSRCECRCPCKFSISFCSTTMSKWL